MRPASSALPRSLPVALDPGLEFRAILDTLAMVVSRTLADGCVIRLVSADGVWLEPAAVRHRDPAMEVVMRDVLASAPQRADEHLSGQVLRTRRPVNVPRIEPDRLKAMIKPEYAPAADAAGPVSLLLVPLAVGGNALGVLVLCRMGGGPAFDDADASRAEELASRIADTVDQARLYGQLVERLARYAPPGEIEIVQLVPEPRSPRPRG